MTIFNPQYTRFVRQTSNGYSRVKYGFRAMQSDLLTQLKAEKWHESKVDNKSVTTVANKVTLTDGVFNPEEGEEAKQSTYTAYINDKYDVFKQGGDANTEDGTFCGYAGCVAYRITVPAFSSTLEKIRLRFATSRYLRSGLKIHVKYDTETEENNGMPTENWGIIRGTTPSSLPNKTIYLSTSTASTVEGVKSWGYMAQQVDTLIESSANEQQIEIDVSNYPYSQQYQQRIWVYITLEDYEDYWTLYNPTEPRYYSIEGSAQLIGGNIELQFTGSETFTDSWVRISDNWPIGETATDLTAKYFGKCNLSQGENRTSEGYKEAFGKNLCCPTFSAGIMTASKNWEQLLNIDRFKRKDYFNTSESGTVSYAVEHYCNLEDMDVFASSLQDCMWYNGAYLSYGCKFNQIDCTVRFNSDTQTIFYNQSNETTIKHPSGIDYSSWFSFVPANKTSYNKIKYTSPNIHMINNGKACINVWRTKSQDAAGTYGWGVIQSLLSHQEMYLPNTKKVETTLTGTGTLTENMTFSATADLVGKIRLNYAPGQTQNLEANLTSEVYPGDILIYCMCVEDWNVAEYAHSADTSYSISCYVQPVTDWSGTTQDSYMSLS